MTKGVTIIYVYDCNECGEKKEIIKPAADYNKKEHCPICHCVMTREFAPRKIHLSGTAVQDKKWQPALGYAATDSELKRAAKEKGWTEIGNERQDKHLKTPELELPNLSDDDIRAISGKIDPL